MPAPHLFEKSDVYRRFVYAVRDISVIRSSIGESRSGAAPTIAEATREAYIGVMAF
jgi:hypothetical protein